MIHLELPNSESSLTMKCIRCPSGDPPHLLVSPAFVFFPFFLGNLSASPHPCRFAFFKSLLTCELLWSRTGFRLTFISLQPLSSSRLAGLWFCQTSLCCLAPDLTFWIFGFSSIFSSCCCCCSSFFPLKIHTDVSYKLSCGTCLFVSLVI